MLITRNVPPHLGQRLISRSKTRRKRWAQVICARVGLASGSQPGAGAGGGTVPEAQEGGPIALVRSGDAISIDAESNVLSVDISDEEMQRRRAAWQAPPFKEIRGTLYKYIKNVKDASEGCVTDE